MEKQESGRTDGLVGLLTTAVATTVAAVSTMWNAMTKDGTLAAAGRQGADELAVALRAFPESIQADEPGTILNPTQGEIAADRSPLRDMHTRSSYGTLGPISELESVSINRTAARLLERPEAGAAQPRGGLENGLANRWKGHRITEKAHAVRGQENKWEIPGYAVHEPSQHCRSRA